MANPQQTCDECGSTKDAKSMYIVSRSLLQDTILLCFCDPSCRSRSQTIDHPAPRNCTTEYYKRTKQFGLLQENSEICEDRDSDVEE